METLADQVTQQQLTSPELIRQMLHSVSPQSPSGYVVTPAEFSEIMGTVTNIAAGIMIAGILGMIFRMPVLMLSKKMAMRGDKGICPVHKVPYIEVYGKGSNVWACPICRKLSEEKLKREMKEEKRGKG